MANTCLSNREDFLIDGTIADHVPIDMSQILESTLSSPAGGGPSHSRSAVSQLTDAWDSWRWRAGDRARKQINSIV
jgi:hypothetical protein